MKKITKRYNKKGLSLKITEPVRDDKGAVINGERQPRIN